MTRQHPLSVTVLAMLAPISLCPATFAQAQAVRTVIAVHWSAENFPSTAETDAAIREVLVTRSPTPVDYYAEYLESDRFPEDASLAFRDYIRRKFRGRRIDVVVANADPALQFVLRHRGTLFPNAAIVFMATSLGAASAKRAGAPATGVIGDVAYGKTLQLALALHPSTERVFVVAQAPAVELQDYTRQELSDFEKRIQLIYINERSMPQLLATIKSVPARSLILFIRYSREDPGQVMFPDTAARLVAQASPVPVYGISDLHIGSGIVGGMVRRPPAIGTQAGEIVLQILAGRRPQDIPFEYAALLPTFDWRQVQRWGIDPSRLPQGSVVRFRIPTTWEQHRWQIAVAISLIVFQAVLIGGLLFQHNRRRRAEAITRTSDAALRRSYERIRQLAGRLINAQEAARTRIASDLHDDVCQELAGVSIAVSILKRQRHRVQDNVTQEALSQVQRRALGVAERVRRLSHDLHPDTLRHLGLAAALEAHCIEIEQHYDVQVTFKTEGDLRDIGHETALCLFRITQEATRNAATHGNARRLTVTACRLESDAELTVTDDGIGFDLEAARERRSGLGLVTMEERARLVGGQLEIVAEPGKGTALRATVPVSVHGAEMTEEEPDGHGGRHEYAQSHDRRRSQVIFRRYRSAPQGTLRGCRDGRRRQHARRSSAPASPGRSSA